MILVLLVFGVDQGLFLCFGLIANDHGHEIGIRYIILGWICNWEGTVWIMIDMLGWLFPLVLGGDGVDYRMLVKFALDNHYCLDKSMVRHKALCDDHASCPGSGQDSISMSLWLFGHKDCNRMVHTLWEGLVTTKNYLRMMKTFQVDSRVRV